MSKFKILTVLVLCSYLPIWITVSGSPLGIHKFPVRVSKSSLRPNATEKLDPLDDCILDMMEGFCLDEDCPCVDIDWFCCDDYSCDVDNDKCVPTQPKKSP